MTPNTVKTLVVGFAVLVAIVLGWVGYRAANMDAGEQQAATTPAAPSARETPATPPPSAGAPGSGPQPKPDISAEAPGQSAPVTQPPAAASGGSSPQPAAAFDIVRVEPSGDAVVAGRAAPGAKVELLRNGQVISTETANEQGEFVMTPSTLEPGDHQLQLRVAGAGGKTSERVVVVSVPKDGQGEALVVASEPNKPAEVLQAPSQTTAQAAAAPGDPAQAGATAGDNETATASPAANTALRIGAIEVQGGRLYAQGSGPAGTKLRIHLNDAVIADATVGADGNWSLTIERGVTPGNYRVRIDQLAADGRVTARAEAPFDYTATTVVATDPIPEQPDAASSTATTADSEPQTSRVPQDNQPAGAAAGSAGTNDGGQADVVVASVGTVKVRRGDSLWRISQGIYGQGIRYSVIYDANSDQIRNPDLIYPNQVFVVPSRD